MGLCGSKVKGAPARLLLLGASGVGKSTLFKQIKMLHARGFSSEELADGAACIRRMMLDTLRVLLRNTSVQDAMGDAGIDACDRAMGDMAFIDESEEERAQLLALIRAHWRTTAVAAALEALRRGSDHGGWLRSNEWLQWWIEEADRVLAPAYEATPEDMLKLRRSTSGAVELPFAVNVDGKDCEFVLVDMGGQVHEMKHWADELAQPNVGGVIFLASLADFDRSPQKNSWASSWSIMHSDSKSLKLASGKRQKPSLLFNELKLLNDLLRGNPFLQRIPLVVMLNKSDLFDQRVAAGAKFYRHFVDCPKKVARKPHEARRWLARQIETTENFIKAPHAQMACFTSCATDMNNAKRMVEEVLNAVTAENVQNFFANEIGE